MKIYVYVTDGAGRLRGVMTLHELLNAPAGRSVGQVMQRHVISLSADESVYSVIRNPYWQSYHALPVIDANGILLGVIRQKSIHHLMDHLDHEQPVKTALGMFTVAGELFAHTAASLVADLVAAGDSRMPAERQTGVRAGGDE
jgi:magnesium transporter